MLTVAILLCMSFAVCSTTAFAVTYDEYNGHYYVNGVGGIGVYDTTYYGFRTYKDELFLFKNDKSIEIVDYKDKKQYKFPERLKEYDTKI